MKKILKMICMACVLIFASIAIVACTPGSVEKAETKMEEAGYTVVAYDQGKDAEGFVGGIIATKVLKGEAVIAILFDSKDNAKDFADSWDNDKYEKATVDGKWVYAGTEQAINDFKA